MSDLEKLRQMLASHLNSCGVPAVTAWENKRRTPRDTAVTVVSLRSCEGAPAGFRDYLGEIWEESKGCWVEHYGRKAELTFGLDIFAPRSGGESVCAAHFSKLAQVLALSGPEGLNFQKVSCGETVFDEKEGLFHCPVQAVGTVFLEAMLDESGILTDFKVKGTRR